MPETAPRGSLPPGDPTRDEARVVAALRAGGRARRAAARSAWLRWVPAGVAAAIFAVLAVWPRHGVREAARDARRAAITSLELVRDPSSGGTGPSEASSGGAYRLRVTLERPGQPVVYHLDPEGVAALLYPESASAPLRAWRAGTYVLPPGPGAAGWAPAGTPGPETFLALAVPPRTDLAALGDSLAAIVPAPTRSAREAALLEALLRLAGPVRVLHIEQLR